MTEAADILKKMRRHLLLEQAEFARILGINSATYCNYEKGKRLPRLHVVRKLRDLAKENDFEFNTDIFINE